jgi:predicted kinase
MSTLTITRGYPACGKTTWANGRVLKDPSITRISRDDIRFNMLGIPQSQGVGTNEQEIQVSRIHHLLVNEMLASGRNVIVDDTNLQLKVARKWADAAQMVGADFVVKDFEVDVDECIYRNNQRSISGGRHVPVEIIKNMAKKHPFPLPVVYASDAVSFNYRYEPNPLLPEAYIFDVDGTLAQMDGRSPYEWHRVHTDKLKPDVAGMAYALHALGFKIIVMSGRDGACFDLTKQWLDTHRISHDLLVMRPKGDTRKDNIIKVELFREHVAPYYCVRGTFDDRNQVVEMWRSIGLTCFQVCEGNF